MFDELSLMHDNHICKMPMLRRRIIRVMMEHDVQPSPQTPETPEDGICMRRADYAWWVEVEKKCSGAFPAPASHIIRVVAGDAVCPLLSVPVTVYTMSSGMFVSCARLARLKWPSWRCTETNILRFPHDVEVCGDGAGAGVRQRGTTRRCSTGHARCWDPRTAVAVPERKRPIVWPPPCSSRAIRPSTRSAKAHEGRIYRLPCEHAAKEPL